VAPVLVLASFVIGPFPMALVSNGFELGAIFLAILIADEITQRGESTWYEGLQPLAIYAVVGLTFFSCSRPDSGRSMAPSRLNYPAPVAGARPACDSSLPKRSRLPQSGTAGFTRTGSQGV
jgi:hypothetical protein